MSERLRGWAPDVSVGLAILVLGAVELWSMNPPSHDGRRAYLLVLIGFSAAVVGGLGSMPGAIIGSLVIAGLDTLVQAVVPNGAAYRLVFVFLLVIGVLVFRPAGLFGRTVIEKV